MRVALVGLAGLEQQAPGALGAIKRSLLPFATLNPQGEAVRVATQGMVGWVATLVQTGQMDRAVAAVVVLGIQALTTVMLAVVVV